MKKFLSVLAALSIMSSSLFAAVAPSSSALEVEVTKAVQDYKIGVVNPNGSEVYMAAMNELKSGAYKNASDEKNWIIGILAVLLASSISKSVVDDASAGCVDRCTRYDGLPYRVCKRDCSMSSDSH